MKDYRRYIVGERLSQCFAVYGRLNNRWSYALSSGVCPERRRAGSTASARFEVALQSALQETFSYTMAVPNLSGRWYAGNGSWRNVGDELSSMIPSASAPSYLELPAY